MIDFKYHAVSILAVFFALAIGIVLGSVISERGAVTAQQTGLIRSIQADLGRLRTEVTKRERENAALGEMIGPLAGWSVNGRLHGATVGIVAVGGSRESVREVVESVRRAGGEALVATIRLDGGEQPATQTAGVSETASVVADAFLAAGEATALATLERSGAVTLEGERAQAQQLVFVVGKGASGRVLAAVAREARAGRLPGVIVEDRADLVALRREVADGCRFVCFDDAVVGAARQAVIVTALLSPPGVYGTRSFGGALVPPAPAVTAR